MVDTSTGKPDLMAAAQPAEGGNRILAQLEHGAVTAARPARTAGWAVDGWTVGLGALLLAAFGLAWVVHDRAVTPRTLKMDATVTARGTQDLAAAPAEDMDEAEQVLQAAAIVNEPGLAMSTVAQAGPSGLPGASQRREPVSATTIAAARANGQAADMASSHADAARNSLKDSARNGAREASITLSRGSPESAPASAPARPADTDITLLTALVAHAYRPTAVAPERSRDVVERRENDSTAALLARCRVLGPIESMLCRSRICSGRWDSDPECRAPVR